MRVFAFHLLNDYSGSPKVLMQLLNGWQQSGLEVHLVTSSGREGFLSGLPGICYHYYWYRFAANPLVRLLFLCWSQFLLLLQLYPLIRKNDVVYINTVLPFGAALLGKLKGCRVVYHLHETSMKPLLLKRFLFGMVRWAASDVVYVSHYLSRQEPMPASRKHILYNALEDAFLQQARQQRTPSPAPPRGRVLMVCSLKAYKGVQEFVQLATDNAHFAFRLVMNASEVDIAGCFQTHSLPANLEIFPTQTNLHPFYGWADVVLNLSRPDGWVETFGLTILEGMAYGLPAIVPPVGGITELVTEGMGGYQVDSRNRELLNQRLNQLLGQPAVYAAMAEQATSQIEHFSERAFLAGSLHILR